MEMDKEENRKKRSKRSNGKLTRPDDEKPYLPLGNWDSVDAF